MAGVSVAAVLASAVSAVVSPTATVALLINVVIWAPLALFLTDRWLKAAPPRVAPAKPERRWLWLAAAGTLALLFPYIWFVIQALMLLTRARPAGGVRIDPAWEGTRQGAIEAWQKRVVEYEEADQRRFESAKIWYPVELNQEANLLCLAGGSPDSWDLLLSTLAGSFMGSGRRVAVLNLARDHPAAGLEFLATRRDFTVEHLALPGSRGMTSIVPDIDYQTLISVLVEALHGGEPATERRRSERQEDREILRKVAGQLDPTGPTTVKRLLAGIRVVLDRPDGPPGQESWTCSPGEHTRLRGLYPEAQLVHGRVIEHATRLEGQLHDLTVLDPTAPGAPTPANDAVPPALDVIEVAGAPGTLSDLDFDLTAEALFQLVLQGVRRSHIRPDLLVVTRADQQSRATVEALHQACAEHGIKLVLLFERLRQAALDVLGSGGAVAGFMRLGNAQDAEAAVRFIGQDHVWRESQVSRNVTDSLTHSTGTNRSATAGWASAFLQWSKHRGEAVGDSETTAYGRTEGVGVTIQQLKENVIEPHVIQGLPTTGMIFVEIVPGGGRRALNVDFHPRLALLPETSPVPRGA
jgi:hypothetical protein